MPRKRDRFEALMEKMLRGRVNVIERVFLDLAGPAIRELQEEFRERRSDSASIDVVRIVSLIRGTLPGMADKDEEGLRYIGGQIDEDVISASDKNLSRLFNIPIATAAGSEAAVQQWIRTNVELIKSLQGKALDEIELLVSQAVMSGKPTLALMQDIKGRFQVSRSKASLLARDQTAKLTGKINEEQQVKHGITKYVWSTSGDANVRQSHAELDGTIQDWAAPPEIPGEGYSAHPGEDFQCRCVGIPVPPNADTASMVAEAEALKERELVAFQSSPTVRGEIPNQSGFTDWNSKRIGELRSGMRSAVGL